jgi:hypothetical protein
MSTIPTIAETTFRDRLRQHRRTRLTRALAAYARACSNDPVAFLADVSEAVRAVCSEDDEAAV